THDQLVTCMVGRDIQDIYDYRPREQGEVALKVDGLLGPGLREPISFQVRKGEILGLFGLVGAGRTELFRLLSGLERASAGSLELCGQALQLRSPRDAIAAGVLLCPEDRKKEGIIPLGSVAENINISAR
ncbi:ATP-binding cassette domain-containing protein, partial [Pseudomonas sp. PS01302]